MSLAFSRDILFVDDLWCTEEGRDVIIGAFGELQHGDDGYKFHYETAETRPGDYGVEPVLRHIEELPGLAAIILDVMFGDRGDRLGLEILSAVRDRHPALPVFMMTTLDRDNLEVVEKAMELGANEYLVKKPTLAELRTVLFVYAAGSDQAIWGNSKAIRRLRSEVVSVAASRSASVLITGASGTGKELVARAIHRQSPRRKGPFVAVHAAALSSTVLESELFGHEKGAFTGATGQRKGRFEIADGGTLFLDEVSKLDPDAQVKLLRVLEERSFERVGGNASISVDIRLISATNEDLATLVEKNLFREDLMFRLNALSLDLPLLRDRGDDVLILANLFLRKLKAGDYAGYPANRFSSEAEDMLRAYLWPGNVRELHHAVEHAIIYCRSDIVTPDVLPAGIGGSGVDNEKVPGSSAAGLPSDPSQWGAYRVKQDLLMVKEVLLETDWNATVAAKYLFPQVTSPNATYLRRYVSRLQKGPWGVEDDDSVSSLAEGILQRIGRGVPPGGN